MAKDAKPDAWMPKRKVRPGSTLRLELHLPTFIMYEIVLTAAETGELMRMLMCEAVGMEVPPASHCRVQMAYDKREEYRRIKGGFARATLPLATRKAVFERDGGTCRYCSAVVTWEAYHCDHVEPVSKGGSDDISNLAASCIPCNLSKAAKPLADWARA